MILDDHIPGPTAESAPDVQRDGVLNEGDLAITEQRVDSSDLAAPSGDVVRKLVPPIISVTAVGQSAATINAAIVGGARGCTCCDRVPRRSR